MKAMLMAAVSGLMIFGSVAAQAEMIPVSQGKVGAYAKALEIALRESKILCGNTYAASDALRISRVTTALRNASTVSVDRTGAQPALKLTAPLAYGSRIVLTVKTSYDYKSVKSMTVDLEVPVEVMVSGNLVNDPVTGTGYKSTQTMFCSTQGNL